MFLHACGSEKQQRPSWFANVHWRWKRPQGSSPEQALVAHPLRVRLLAKASEVHVPVRVKVGHNARWQGRRAKRRRCFQGIVTPMLLVLRVVTDSIQDLKACLHAPVGSSRDKCMISSASGVSSLGRRTSTISTVGRWAPLATAHYHEPLRR